MLNYCTILGLKASRLRTNDAIYNPYNYLKRHSKFIETMAL